MIEPQAELIHRVDLLVNREQVLDAAARGWQRYFRQHRRRDRIQTIRRNRVAWERLAAGGGASRRVAQRAQPGEITGTELDRRHRKCLRRCPTNALTFIAGKEERSVATDRAAKVRTKVMLPQWRHPLMRVVEIIPAVEMVIAGELEHASVKRIPARLGHHIDQR